MKDIIKMYDEIFTVLNKYEGKTNFDISYLLVRRDLHLFQQKLKDYGINIILERISTNYLRINDYVTIAYFGTEHNRSIYNQDTDVEDELLLEISFSTGAYIFGKDYPKEFFDEFFKDLKSYKPKYIDDTNSALYFSMENAKYIYRDFNSILNKYYKKNEEDIKKRQIQKLEEELRKLRKED